MKKMMKNSVLQSILFVWTLFAMVLAFGACAMAAESGYSEKKTERCSLQSVTVQIGNDETIICDGDLEPIVVDKDVKWSDFLASIRIVDYKIVVNDSCANHEHSKVTGIERNGCNIGEFLTYDETITDKSTNTLDKSKVIENRGYYYVCFSSESCDDMVEVYFTRTYDLEFELDGGTVISGELPTSYLSCRNYEFPYAEKEGYTFKGWKEDDNDNIVTYMYGGVTGDKKFKAQWEKVDEVDRTEITTDMCMVYGTYWTGKECTPDVQVWNLTTMLRKNIDYKISYKNNIDIQEKESDNQPTVIFTGIGKYKGTVEMSFTIDKGFISSKNMEMSGVIGSKLSTIDFCDVIVYNYYGGDTISGKWNWETPEQTIAEGYNSFKATFTPDDQKHYDTKDFTLQVYGKEGDVGKCQISLNTESFSYTGEEHKPTVTVTKDGSPLGKGIDYKIAYKNNVTAGDKTSANAPTVTITGMGDYAGSQSITFTITKGNLKVANVPTASAIEVGNPLSDSTISGGTVVNVLGKEIKGTWSWKGSAIEPTVADSDKTAYEVVFTPEDTNYETVEAPVKLTVNPKDITDGNVEVVMKDICSYIGEEVKPSVIVKDGDTILKEQTDYSVAYKNNVNVCDKTATGAPTITITGMGNYAGSKSITFTITKGNLKVESVPTASAIEVGNPLSDSTISGGTVVNVLGKEIKGTWSWKGSATVPTIADSETTEYEVAFTPEDTNYETVEASVKLTVNPKDITDDNVKVEMKDSCSYIGEEVKPSVVVKDGGTTLTEQTDYTIAYKNNVNVCDKTATEAPTITITGMGNYAGTKSVAFTIAKGTLKVESVPMASAIEDGKPLSDSTISGGKVVNMLGKEIKGTWSWKESATVPTVADSDKTAYEVVFTPEDNGYNPIEDQTLSLTVNPKKEDKKEDVPKEDTPTPDDKKEDVPKEDTPTPDDKKEDVPKEDTPTPDDKKNNTDNQSTPQVGTTQRDKDNKATYKVTKSDNSSVEVAYVAAVKKTSKVVIPATVILADGTTAKVTTVEEGAFKGNRKLKKVTIGKNVTSIGEKAFYNCKKLTSVTIPETVKQIGESAFQNCSKLKQITIETKHLTKKTVGKNAFKGIHKKARFEVPGKKFKAYKKILKAKGAGKKVTYVKISSKK